MIRGVGIVIVMHVKVRSRSIEQVSKLYFQYLSDFVKAIQTCLGGILFDLAVAGLRKPQSRAIYSWE